MREKAVAAAGGCQPITRLTAGRREHSTCCTGSTWLLWLMGLCPQKFCWHMTFSTTRKQRLAYQEPLRCLGGPELNSSPWPFLGFIAGLLPCLHLGIRRCVPLPCPNAHTVVFRIFPLQFAQLVAGFGYPWFVPVINWVDFDDHLCLGGTQSNIQIL